MLRRSIVSEAIGGLLSPVVSGVVFLCSFRCSSVSAAGISPLAFLTASLSRPWETHSRRFSSPSNCANHPGQIRPQESPHSAWGRSVVGGPEVCPTGVSPASVLLAKAHNHRP